MQAKPAQLAYWRRNVRLTLALLGLWFVVTFVAGYHAEWLNDFSLFGFPLGFYLFAQGSLLAYLAIIGTYVAYMNYLDRKWAREAQQQESGTRTTADRH